MRMRANRQVCCLHFHRGWRQEQTGLTFESNTSTGRPENRVYRLSRTLPKELDPLVGQEERRGKGREREREKERGGEGGSCVLDILYGVWASICRMGSVMSLGCHLCSSWSNFGHDIASRKYVFQLKNSTFHLHRTHFLEGPN